MSFVLGPNLDVIVAEGLLNNMNIIAGTGCYLGASGVITGAFASVTEAVYTVDFDEEDAALDPSCPPRLFDFPWTEPFGDTFVDYGQAEGSLYAFENKPITAVDGSGTEIIGIAAGRCNILQGNGLYCFYTVNFPGVGLLTFQGFFDLMVITGGSGCFRGISGFIEGFDIESGFLYEFDLDNVDEGITYIQSAEAAEFGTNQQHSNVDHP